MNDLDVKAEIMRAIGVMAQHQTGPASGAAFWQDIVQACATLIFESGPSINPTHLTTLMWIGAAAHRQSKAEGAV